MSEGLIFISDLYIIVVIVNRNYFYRYFQQRRFPVFTFILRCSTNLTLVSEILVAH